MDFNYLALVREILAMNKQADVTSLSTDRSENAYKIQQCINETIMDMNNILKINGRVTDFNFSTVANQSSYVIEKRVVYPFLGLRQKVDDIPLVKMTTKEFDIAVPDDSASTSSSPAYYYLDGYSGVYAQPTAETITCVSSSSSDTSKLVVQGYDSSDNYIIEEITLTGSSSAASSNTYSHIESISKLATTGKITITGSTTAASILTLNPNETHARYVKIGLYPIPNTAITIYGRAYAEILPLSYANEVPIGLTYKHKNAIILGTYARYMRYVPDNKIENINSAFNNYYTEINKIIAMDSRDPDKTYRMKGPYEKRILTYFDPLERWS
jgi:hypothetical protein